MNAGLHSHRIGGTLMVTINAPDAQNAILPEMASAAIKLLSTAERDESVRAVVLTGAKGIFCSGMDIHHLAAVRARNEAAQIEVVSGLQTLIEVLLNFTRPVIAAVEGFAAGAGLAIALACDMIVAGKSAKFAVANPQIGLTPDSGLAWLLTKALPRQIALEMMLTGEPVNADKMCALGVVNHVVDDSEASLAAQALAERIASLAPNVMASTKLLAMEAGSLSLTQYFANEKVHFVASVHHRNGIEGIDAFIARKKPLFK